MKKASVDKTLLFAVIALIIIGIIAVYSSTSVLAFIKSKYASKGGLTYLQKHLFTLFLGSILMIVFIYFPKEKLKYLAIPLLIISFILLVLVFSPMGVSAGGARRWIKLWPSVFQPSEVVKLAMVFFLHGF